MIEQQGGRLGGQDVELGLHNPTQASGDRKPVAIAPAAVAPNSPRFSPDGRGIAYGSIESQRAEIYVVPYSGVGGKVQISANGGVQASWRRCGRGIC
mgnify:CR=1 FL=1